MDSDSRAPPFYRFVSDATAQSEPVAVVLLIGLTIIGTGAVVLFGANAIGETQETTDLAQAEHGMTQLDSTASLVAHGNTDVQRMGLLGTSDGDLRLREEGSWMRVRIVNRTAPNETVFNESLGSVVYERGQTTIAYQGGGVWRHRDNGSTMVSPPEFHYRGGTLTLPLVLVRGESLSGGNVVIRQAGPTNGRYPNESASPPRRNPLDNGTVRVAVHSRYYQAWGRYFEERTSGSVNYDHDSDTVTIRLITPFNDGFENAVAATQQGGITVNGDDPPPSPSETGVNYPSADERIEDLIADCESGGCTSYSGGDITSAGTYFASSSTSPDGITISAAGEVELVVDGSFDPGDIAVTGSGNVSVYVRQDFSVNGQVNSAPDSGDASQFRTLVHSDGAVNLNGNYQYVGLVYAPGSSISLNGGGAFDPNIIGGVVGETVTVNGNPNEFQYDEAVDKINLQLGPEAPRILYLHVSTTKVEISG